MDCEKFKNYLDEYENLNETDKLEMNKHASECANCRSELDFMLAIMETAKSLPKIEPPADFMEKLNIRIDAEEKKKQNIAMRVLKNMHKNWKQYTVAAACFALVAVVTSNSQMLVNKMEGNNDGVIQEETVVTDNQTGTSSTASTPTPQDKTIEENKTSVFEEPKVPALNATTAPKTQEKISTNNTNTAVAKANTNSVVVPKTNTTRAVSTISPAIENSTRKNTETTSVETKNVVPTSETENQPITEVQAASENSVSDESNAINNDDVDNVKNEYSLPQGENVGRSAVAYSVDAESDYALAIGTYYKIDKDGNPIMEEEKKPIGSIKISSDDADEAMSVILQYTYDVEGDFYTTSSERLTAMLASLNGQGISYTNYTPAYEGDITFKLVIS